MAHDNAHCAEIQGFRVGRVEKGLLEDSGREDDLVLIGRVVGVYRRRCHAPEGFVDGLVEFDEVLTEGELIGADVVHKVLVPLDVQVAVQLVQLLWIQNELGVTNHVRDGFGLIAGCLARLLVHPVESLKIALEGVLDGGDHRLGQRFGFASKILPYKHGTDCKAQNVVGVRHTGAPRLFVAFRAHEELAKDLSGIAKSLGQTGQEGSDDVPAQIVVNHAENHKVNRSVF